MRKEFDPKDYKYLFLNKGLQDKSDGVSLQMGDFQAEWERKFGKLSSDSQENSRRQASNDQQIFGILAEIKGLQESQKKNLETLESKIVQVREIGTGIDGRVREQRTLVDNWTLWVKNEITRLEKVVQELKETPFSIYCPCCSPGWIQPKMRLLNYENPRTPHLPPYG